ncbi:MAG: hypothetical protein ACJ790_16275 [Myxococcaceae bacterium]
MRVRTTFLIAAFVTAAVGAAIAAEQKLAASPDDPLTQVLDDPSRAPELRLFRDRAITEAAKGDAKVKALLLANIDENLREKAKLQWKGQRFHLGAEALRRTVIEYEIWKYRAYVSSGVFPKRYFGYFDGAWDTAAREKELKETTHSAVSVVNAFAQKHGGAVRITDAEVSVTIVAEGAALLLREHQSDLDNIHPVYGIGLDDVATGFAKNPALVGELDAALGTKLGQAVTWKDGEPYLLRYFTFKEGIAATAFMWLYEKDLAATKLKARDGTELMKLPLEDQFIYGSLVYNSGVLFSAERVTQVKSFDTGAYLFCLS